MAVTFPTTTDVRATRDRANQVMFDVIDPLRAPGMALLGLGDVAVAAARDALVWMQTGRSGLSARLEELPVELEDLRDRITVEDFRRLADSYVAAVYSVYSELVERGEDTYSTIVAQPEVARALARVERVAGELGGSTTR